MPNNKCFRVAIASIALGVVFSQAHALDIVINAGSGLSGNAAALASFERAAQQWEALFVDPITVNINANLQNLGGGGIIGSTSANFLQGSYTTIRNAMVTDSLDEASNGIVSFLPTAAQFTGQLTAGSSFTGNVVLTSANAKALGFSSTGADGTIIFNSNFSFHYGAGAPPGGLMDFETVASHEIGHALGFISAVDDADQGDTTISLNPLDLYRFSTANIPTTNAQFTNNPRNLVPNAGASFSDSVNNWSLSTGFDLGDGNQASHWKDDDFGGPHIGIMDPTLDFGDRFGITTADVRAFDLIGWDLQPVPEPASLVALGLGAVAVLRRRRQSAK